VIARDCASHETARVFIAYQLSGLRDRTSEIAFMITIVLVTAAILVLYAL
jgi:hypothetical protein